MSILRRIVICALLGPGIVASFADDWPQFRGPGRDGVWRETGIVRKFEAPQIKLRWSVPVSNGYSSPTVAAGRVYVMDRVVEPGEQERVHCFDWQTGRPVWAYAYPCVYKGISYPDGPRASVTVHDGRAYTMGSMGHLFCFEAATGKVVWSHDCFNEYAIRMPDWGIAADPFIDGEQVIVHIGGSNGACLVSFDRRTGKERWRALDDRAGYAAPAIVRQAGQRVLVVWTGDRVVGLDPNSGRLHWEYPYVASVRIGATFTPVIAQDLLFISSWYDGALLLRLRPDRLAVEKVWHRKGPNERSTEAFHALFTTPLILGSHIYGIDTFGELRCLEAGSGERVWESQAISPRARNVGAHFVRHADEVWVFNEKGELIVSRFTPQGFEEISRAQLIKPTRGQFNGRGGVVWSHPAFAYKHVFARNDEELVCASLEATQP